MVKRATLSAAEAAIYLGVSYWKLLDMVKRGDITPIRAGRLLLFRESGLNDWMEMQERSINPGRKNENLLTLVKKVQR